MNNFAVVVIFDVLFVTAANFASAVEIIMAGNLSTVYVHCLYLG